MTNKKLAQKLQIVIEKRISLHYSYSSTWLCSNFAWGRSRQFWNL